MRWPSNFANGSSIGTEPVASTMLVPLISRTPPSAAWTATVRPGLSVARPAIGVTLLALNSRVMPPVNCFTILSLRPTMALTSIVGLSALMPWSA